jgi:tRNA(Ile)-lysidine synthase
LRTRRDGDRFAPSGLHGHTRKLKEWLIDHKVPRALRDRLPLLVVDGEVAALLWGDAWAVSEHFAEPHDASVVVYLGVVVKNS